MPPKLNIHPDDLPIILTTLAEKLTIAKLYPDVCRMYAVTLCEGTTRLSFLCHLNFSWAISFSEPFKLFLLESVTCFPFSICLIRTRTRHKSAMLRKRAILPKQIQNNMLRAK